MSLKPKNSNLHQMYLELYQKDELNKYLPFFAKYKYRNNIITRLHTAMRTISKEILDLYHFTRHKKNSCIYDILTLQYKTILYNIHGIYIKNKKNNINNKPKSYLDLDFDGDSINIRDVYNYLKTISIQELKQVFCDRIEYCKKYNENNKNIIKMGNSIFPRKCLATTTLCSLMFPNI